MGLVPGMKPRCLTAILLLIFAVLAAGCATTPKENENVTLSNKDTKPAESNQEITPPGDDPCIDPYEKFNRKFYKVTDTVDRNVLEPVANSYIDTIPNPVRTSVGNFYDNLAYPGVALNGFLQGKVKQGMGDSLRFLVNTTVGVAGLFDPATPLGLPEHNEDFGQTLGVWGVDNTSYIYLPFLGPSSNRDIIGLPVDAASNMIFYAGFFFAAPVTIPLGILAVVDKRARVAEEIRLRDQAALDPYLFTREAYWQHRESLVFDGKPPIETYDNLFINDDDDLSDTSETNASNEPCPKESLQHSSTN